PASRVSIRGRAPGARSLSRRHDPWTGLLLPVENVFGAGGFFPGGVRADPHAVLSWPLGATHRLDRRVVSAPRQGRAAQPGLALGRGRENLDPPAPGLSGRRGGLLPRDGGGRLRGFLRTVLEELEVSRGPRL